MKKKSWLWVKSHVVQSVILLLSTLVSPPSGWGGGRWGGWGGHSAASGKEGRALKQIRTSTSLFTIGCIFLVHFLCIHFDKKKMHYGWVWWLTADTGLKIRRSWVWLLVLSLASFVTPSLFSDFYYGNFKTVAKIEQPDEPTCTHHPNRTINWWFLIILPRSAAPIPGLFGSKSWTLLSLHIQLLKEEHEHCNWFQTHYEPGVKKRSQ